MADKFNDDFMNVMGLRWANANELNPDDPYYSELVKHNPNATYAVDSDGYYVSASRMGSLWDDYVVRQEQPDLATAREVEREAADRYVHSIGITQADRQQVNNLGRLGLLTVGTGAMIPAAMASPLPLAMGLAGGLIGDWVGNNIVNYASNGEYNTWGDMIADKTNNLIEADNAQITNPLALAGAIAGGGINKRPFDVGELVDLNGSWNNWGDEHLVQFGDNVVYKIPKTVDDVPESFTSPSNIRYKHAVRKRLRDNQVPGFEPYEYAGYIKSERGYTPVYKQNKLETRGLRTPEDLQFNEEALADIEAQMANNPGRWESWNVGDYNLAHNIGKNADGVGKLYDVNKDRSALDALKEAVMWRFNPYSIGTPVVSNRLLNNVNENNR